jgi:hypothetical protein
VLFLHELGVADLDPRLDAAGWEFTRDAAARTLASMGVTR